MSFDGYKSDADDDYLPRSIAFARTAPMSDENLSFSPDNKNENSNTKETKSVNKDGCKKKGITQNIANNNNINSNNSTTDNNSINGILFNEDIERYFCEKDTNDSFNILNNKRKAASFSDILLNSDKTPVGYETEPISNMNHKFGIFLNFKNDKEEKESKNSYTDLDLRSIKKSNNTFDNSIALKDNDNESGVEATGEKKKSSYFFKKEKKFDISNLKNLNIAKQYGRQRYANNEAKRALWHMSFVAGHRHQYFVQTAGHVSKSGNNYISQREKSKYNKYVYESDRGSRYNNIGNDKDAIDKEMTRIGNFDISSLGPLYSQFDQNDLKKAFYQFLLLQQKNFSEFQKRNSNKVNILSNNEDNNSNEVKNPFVLSSNVITPDRQNQEVSNFIKDELNKTSENNISSDSEDNPNFFNNNYFYAYGDSFSSSASFPQSEAINIIRDNNNSFLSDYSSKIWPEILITAIAPVKDTSNGYYDSFRNKGTRETDENFISSEIVQDQRNSSVVLDKNQFEQTYLSEAKEIDNIKHANEALNIANSKNPHSTIIDAPFASPFIKASITQTKKSVIVLLVDEKFNNYHFLFENLFEEREPSIPLNSKEEELRDDVCHSIVDFTKKLLMIEWKFFNTPFNIAEDPISYPSNELNLNSISSYSSTPLIGIENISSFPNVLDSKNKSLELNLPKKEFNLTSPSGNANDDFFPNSTKELHHYLNSFSSACKNNINNNTINNSINSDNNTFSSDNVIIKSDPRKIDSLSCDIKKKDTGTFEMQKKLPSFSEKSSKLLFANEPHNVLKKYSFLFQRASDVLKENKNVLITKLAMINLAEMLSRIKNSNCKYNDIHLEKISEGISPKKDGQFLIKKNSDYIRKKFLVSKFTQTDFTGFNLYQKNGPTTIDAIILAEKNSVAVETDFNIETRASLENISNVLNLINTAVVNIGDAASSATSVDEVDKVIVIIKKLLKFAAPASIGMALNFLVYTFPLSRIGFVLGEDKLDAASVGFFAISIIGLYPLNGLLFAIDTLCSYEYGRDHNSDYMGLVLQRGLLIGVAYIIFPLLPIFIFALKPFLTLLYGVEVSEMAMEFLLYSPFFLLGNTVFVVFDKFLSNQMYPHYSMIAVVVGAFFSVLIHWFMVPLGLRYAMLGIVIVWLLQSIIIFALTIRNPITRRCLGKLRFWEAIRLKEIKDFYRIAVPSAIFVAAESTTFDITVLFAAKVSNQAGAAWSAMLNVLLVLISDCGGLSKAACAIVGSELGMGHIKNARKTFFLTTIFAVCFALINIVIFLVFYDHLLHLFGATKNILGLAHSIKWMLPFLHIFDCVQFTFQGLFSGIGCNHYGAIILLAALWGIGIPTSALLTFYFKKGLPGIIIGLISGTGVEVPLMILFFLKVNWDQLVHKTDEAEEEEDDEEEEELEEENTEGGTQSTIKLGIKVFAEKEKETQIPLTGLNLKEESHTSVGKKVLTNSSPVSTSISFERVREN